MTQNLWRTCQTQSNPTRFTYGGRALSPAETHLFIEFLRAREAVTGDRYDSLTMVAKSLAELGAGYIGKRALLEALVGRVNAERRLIRIERALVVLDAWLAEDAGRDYTVSLSRTGKSWRTAVRLSTAEGPQDFVCQGGKMVSLERALERAAQNAARPAPIVAGRRPGFI